MTLNSVAVSALAILALASFNSVVLADPAPQPDNAAPAAGAAPAGQTPPPTTATPTPSQDLPPAAPATPPGILLRLKFKKAEVFVYRVSADTSGVMTMMGRSIPMDTSTSMVMTQSVKGVRPNGTARLIIGMHDFTMSVQGKSMPVGDKMKSMMTGTSELMDTQGNLVLNMGAANPMASMFSSGGPSGLSAYAFPDGPVHVGDTWTKDTSLSSTVGMTMTTTYSLDNAWMENGKQFVAIHSSSTGTMSMQPTAQMPMKMTGPISSTSDIVFDDTTGVVRQIKGTATIQFNMAYNMPNPQGGAATPQSMSDETTYSTTMQLVRVQQP